jgi:NADH pyrophosphatase NudC (nudix superfamily)
MHAGGVRSFESAFSEQRNGMELDPQLTTAFAVTTGVGFLMILVGAQKHLLEWRRSPRRCPSCGRRIERRTCGCTTARD